MGVTAVNAMQHAALVKDRLYAGDDHLHFTHRGKQRLSLKQSSLKWPSSPRRPRRALLRRSSTGHAAAMKRPVSVSDPVASSVSKPSAARKLRSSFNPSTSAAPASGMEPQQLFDLPSRETLSSLKQELEDDLDVDYREAAAVLEHLFSESPSVELDFKAATEDMVLPHSPSTSLVDSDVKLASRLRGLKKNFRKDLTARIIHHRKRLNELSHQCSQERSKSGAATKLSNSIWSSAAANLLQQYGEVINFTAQNWTRLRGELLSAEEERWLGSLMKPAKALLKIKDSLMQQTGRELSNEDWARAAKTDVATLARHLALHKAARNKLVKMNLRLVKYQARKYEKESLGSSLTVEELCQEGVKGLITAVDRFNPTRGVRFSTYAVFWIRNSILRAQTRSGFPIRAPFNFAEVKMNINKVRWEMRLESGETEKLAGENLRKVLKRAGVHEEKYKAIMRSTPKMVSLHKRDPHTGAELIERLADPSSHHGASSRYLVGAGGGGIEATDPLLRIGIDDVLDSLKPKESFVLRQRFGLDGKGERALGEISQNMQISREMVRRYEVRGLLKLKHPTRLDYLRSFLPVD
ncbi:hypothetical protein GOP47_0015440 [Adiantum capillus-veneris]|uniref:Uncharacterized protein n=1 Tax=Adiantum capillus-veneris TaxID=13818 RepID=A0A9D4UJP2_ADICA|nr:hypothetical protein GOP47_0015440 [Adiantum capillus-veneris]